MIEPKLAGTFIQTVCLSCQGKPALLYALILEVRFLLPLKSVTITNRLTPIHVMLAFQQWSTAKADETTTGTVRDVVFSQI